MIAVRSGNNIYFINDPRDDGVLFFRIYNGAKSGNIVDYQYYQSLQGVREGPDGCVIIVNSVRGIYYTIDPNPKRIVWRLISHIPGKKVIGYFANYHEDLLRMMVFYSDGSFGKLIHNPRRKIAEYQVVDQNEFGIDNGFLLTGSKELSIVVSTDNNIYHIDSGNDEYAALIELDKVKARIIPEKIISVSMGFSNSRDIRAFIIREIGRSTIITKDKNESENYKVVSQELYDDLKRDFYAFNPRNIRYTLDSDFLVITDVKTGVTRSIIGVNDVATSTRMGVSYFITNDGRIGVIDDYNKKCVLRILDITINNPKFPITHAIEIGK